ncbi:MAG: transposase family protein [Frankiales bacterium]|nr:transposase family protein [Frankiales bacterium]
MEHWAEIRRLHLTEKMPIKVIARRLGVARNTVRAALAAAEPPRYERPAKGSALDALEPQYLDAEVADLDRRRLVLVERAAPQLFEANGVGLHTAATLLVTVGDNPERLRNEATFARLCGVAPIPTGSGKTSGYHRLHRGGDRQANSALWTIVLSRMATDPATRSYVERRRKEGKRTRFIMRCLKRHVAREIYKLLPHAGPLLTT